MSLLLVNANTLHIPLADGSVHMALTSPPYWGLRSYAGTATWEGGDAECDHVETIRPQRDHNGRDFGDTRGNEDSKTIPQTMQYRDICGKCGAIRIDAQLGLEKLHDCGAWTRNTGKVIGFKEVEDWDEDETPDGERVFDFKGYKVVPIYESAQGCGECFICHCRQWAAEIWRVLRDDGTFWLNIGDSYASQGGPLSYSIESILGGKDGIDDYQRTRHSPPGLKSKDMVLIPQRLALALQADGWYVRSEIIWAKPNPMPESVTDRPTKSHETVWLLAKAQRYYYDADAVRELQVEASFERSKYDRKNDKTNKGLPTGKDRDDDGKIFASGLNALPYTLNPASRNRRDVWQIATAPYSGAHFATWPPALVEPMIKAGTSERGCCPSCGKQWERVVDVDKTQRIGPPSRGGNRQGVEVGNGVKIMHNGFESGRQYPKETTGWRPSCLHFCTTSDIITYENVIREWFNDDKELYNLWERDVRKALENGKNKILLEGLCEEGLGGSSSKPEYRVQEGTYTLELSGWKIHRQKWLRIHKNYWSSYGKQEWLRPRASDKLGKGTWLRSRTRRDGRSSYQWQQGRQSTRESNGSAEKESQSFSQYKTYSEKITPSGSRTSRTKGTTETYLIPLSPTPSIILDPFAGSGTSLLVARQLGRNAIGLDLSFPYLQEQARSRLSLDALDAWVNGKKDGKVITDLPLFATLD